jgi:dTDP-4-dehydrorhamnose reductase
VRPANSRLSVRKLETTFGLRMPDWRLHVDRMLDEILKKK